MKERRRDLIHYVGGRKGEGRGEMDRIKERKPGPTGRGSKRNYKNLTQIQVVKSED